MDQQPLIFQHFQRYEKAKKRRNFFVKLAGLLLQSLIGIYVLSYWHLWFFIISYVCIMGAGFIFLIVNFLKDKKPGEDLEAND